MHRVVASVPVSFGQALECHQDGDRVRGCQQLQRSGDALHPRADEVIEPCSSTVLCALSKVGGAPDVACPTSVSTDTALTVTFNPCTAPGYVSIPNARAAYHTRPVIPSVSEESLSSSSSPTAFGVRCSETILESDSSRALGMTDRLAVRHEMRVLR